MQAISDQAIARQGQVDAEKTDPDMGRSDLKQDQGQTKHATDRAEGAVNDVFLVNFSPDDPENPLNWSSKLKWGVTAAVSGTGFVRIMVSTVRLRA
jgi:hypothetical protein